MNRCFKEIALLIVLIIAGLAPVMSKEPLIAKIWVDKGCGAIYEIGEDILVSFNVSRDAYVVIKDDYSGGYRILYSGYVNGSKIYNFTIEASSPASTVPVYRRLVIRAEDKEGEVTTASCRIAVVVIEKPDIAVGRIRVMRLSVFPNEVIVMAEIVNLGKGNTGSFTIGLYIDNKLIATRKVTNILPTLYTGTTFHVNIPLRKREHVLRIVVDIYNEVEELSEKNNERSVKLVLKRRPFPIIPQPIWQSKP